MNDTSAEKGVFDDTLITRVIKKGSENFDRMEINNLCRNDETDNDGIHIFKYLPIFSILIVFCLQNNL